MLKVKKLHLDALLPKRAKEGDAGIDIYAISKEYINNASQIKYKTGIAIELPEGHFGLLAPRSSSVNTCCRLSNSMGIIDLGYRGEISFIFDKVDNNLREYEVGERVGQLVVLPYTKCEVMEVNELSDSERGTGGFGSSGRI